MSRYQFDFIDKLDKLESLKADWGALFSVCDDASPYLAFEWIKASWTLEFKTGRHIVVSVADENGVVAIFPLQEQTLTTRPFPRRELIWGGGGWATQRGGIIHPRCDADEVLTRLPAFLASIDKSWSLCRLSGVPEGSALWTAGKNSSNVKVAFLGETTLINLPDSSDQYLQQQSANRRSWIRRHSRRLEKTGQLRLERSGLEPCFDMSALQRLIEDAFEVSDRSWQGATVEGQALGNPQIREFVTEVSLKMAAIGLLDLSVLYLDDRPVSFVWGAARWPATTFSKLGFLTDLREHNVGSIHVWLLIQDSIVRGGKYIDYGHEFSESKRNWSRQSQPLYELRCYLPTFTSRLLRLYELRPKWIAQLGKILLKPSKAIKK
jgi:CelD/BcsL family acetyltransferase involved in cellulose biosynthesis